MGEREEKGSGILPLGGVGWWMKMGNDGKRAEEGKDGGWDLQVSGRGVGTPKLPSWQGTDLLWEELWPEHGADLPAQDPCGGEVLCLPRLCPEVPSERRETLQGPGGQEKLS